MHQHDHHGGEHGHDHEPGHDHGAHAHGHPPGHAGHLHGAELQEVARRRLLIALVLTAGFMLVEVAAGLLSGSLALLSDAGHMLTDAGALGLALWAQALGRRARTESKTFGYRRAEILAAAANGIILGVTAILVVVEALRRVGDPPHVQGRMMLLVAALGLVVNLLAAWVLAGGKHASVNVRAAAAHVLADAAGSVAAMIAALLVLGPGWTLADPITSILISLLILVGAWRLLREAANVLMEGVPATIDVGALERLVCQTRGVTGVHDLHVWSIAGDAPVVTAHITLAAGHHGVQVAAEVGRAIEHLIGPSHVTVQPEAAPAEQRLVPREALWRPPK
jgi:cobalt-zinc-cadmium efflux system protein